MSEQHASRSGPPANSSAKVQLTRPRPRALVVGLALVIALAFLIPYVNFCLNKYDWAFRPLALGPVFLLCLLAWPINLTLRRYRPEWALTGPELLLVYAMMALSAALSNEGLFGYVIANAVHPPFFASPGNRWAELIFPDVPPWMMLHQREAINWFYEGAPPGAPFPYRLWIPPVLSWSVFAFGAYMAAFSLAALIRRDWIEGQRLEFPLTALPLAIAKDADPSTQRSILRSPFLWIGAALPISKSLLQMAHTLSPAVPYSSLYWPLGTLFGRSLPWSAISDTTVYIGFETIGIMALVPAEVALSFWLFFLVNRVQLLFFAALGFGQEGVSASIFSPRAFVQYQSAGAGLMLAAILVWQSRKRIAAAFRSLVGRGPADDALSPISPRTAALGMVLGLTICILWARRTGMELWAFLALMGIYGAFSLVVGRLVCAGGIFAPDIGLTPSRMVTGLAGTARFSSTSLTMMTFLETTFMLSWKVNFFHFAMNDLKIGHSARLPGRLLGWALLLSVLLMLLVAPWTAIHAGYSHGAFRFDTWQFQDRQTYALNELVANLQMPRGTTPFMPLGLLCGAALMLALNWLHVNFLWWGISPLGLVMSDTYFMNARIWTNAFIAWLLVTLIRRFGGLRLYRQIRPAFLGMILGHFFIFGVRSLLDPLLGLHMQLSAWQ